MAEHDPWVAELAAKGLLNEAAARRLDELETRAHVPLARELHGLLYLGALLILFGVGAAVKDRLLELGPMTIVASLALGAAACLAWCFSRAAPYAPGKVEPPNAAFDYVLYVGCGLLGILFTYMEWKWKLLGDWWDLYLLASGAAFALLAYRLDNRLVLGAGLVNLWGFLVARAARWRFGEYGTRTLGVLFGASLLAAAEQARASGVKPHFEPLYLRLGANAALLALLTGAGGFDRPELYLLLLAAAALGARAFGRRDFETFAYALVYAYVGTLASCMRVVSGFDAELWLVMLSSAGVLGALLWARRAFREAA